jgi:hypothetical protein
MLMSPIGPPAGYARKPAATATAKRELRDLSANAKALGDVIDRLSKTAHDALNFRPKALQHLRANLRILATCADESVIAEQPAGTGKGAPTKEQANRIADVVAIHYFRLTGREPSPSVRDSKATGQLTDCKQSSVRLMTGVHRIAASGRMIATLPGNVTVGQEQNCVSGSCRVGLYRGR